MKPIETGCLAIIIRSWANNNGKTVTVGNYIGEVFGWVGRRRWEIDRAILGTEGSECSHTQEHQLMRIDGYDARKKQEAMASKPKLETQEN